MRISITEKSGNKKNWKLIEELHARIRGMIEQYPAQVAESFLGLIEDSAPDINGYAKNLKIQRFKIEEDHAYGVILPGYSHSNRLKIADKSTTVLYVKPRVRGKSEPDPATSVLERYNPWTMTTLPFEPDKKVSTMMSRKVTEREVKAIEGDRTMDRKRQVDDELKGMGVSVKRRHPILLSRRVSRDLLFEVLRSEYGLAGERHVAHIRPSMTKIQKMIEPSLWRWWVKQLVMPNNKKWKRPVSKPSGRASFAKKVRPLQDLIIDGGTPRI